MKIVTELLFTKDDMEFPFFIFSVAVYIFVESAKILKTASREVNGILATYNGYCVLCVSYDIK